jgi:hypothetical protein
VTGDFNLILDARDKNNPRVNRRSMAAFRRVVNDLELKEAHLLGRRFTWSNERDTPTLERLDRWFCSVDWDAMHPSASLSALSSSHSDHAPLLLRSAMELPGGRRFRFESFWVKLQGFHDAVAASWGRAVPLRLDALERLDLKLRRVARDLQSWSARRVGSIRDQLLVANEVIIQLDKAQDSRPLSPLELDLRRGLKRRVLGLASLERTIARQRARVEGAADVDASAQFLRIQASKRRRRNHIGLLRDGDRGELDQAGKEALATAFYEELLGRPQPREHDLSLPALGLHPLDLSSLDAPFSADEIWCAVKAMPAISPLGPMA